MGAAAVALHRHFASLYARARPDAGAGPAASIPPARSVAVWDTAYDDRGYQRLRQGVHAIGSRPPQSVIEPGGELRFSRQQPHGASAAVVRARIVGILVADDFEACFATFGRLNVTPPDALRAAVPRPQPSESGCAAHRSYLEDFC